MATATKPRVVVNTKQQATGKSGKKPSVSFDDKAKHLRGNFASGVATTSSTVRQSLEGFGQ